MTRSSGALWGVACWFSPMMFSTICTRARSHAGEEPADVALAVARAREAVEAGEEFDGGLCGPALHLGAQTDVGANFGEADGGVKRAGRTPSCSSLCSAGRCDRCRRDEVYCSLVAGYRSQRAQQMGPAPLDADAETSSSHTRIVKPRAARHGGAITPAHDARRASPLTPPGGGLRGTRTGAGPPQLLRCRQ